ncbi:hypothetical protein ACP275_14G266300 [Erythranthe tilingii]
MAKAKLVSTFAIVLLLIFSIGIMSTEERVLLVSNMVKTGISRIPETRIHNNRMILNEIVTQGTDFRPTTPGHSPGIGHANGPASTEPKA